MRNQEMGPIHKRKRFIGSAITPKTERGRVEGDRFVVAPADFQPTLEVKVISQFPSGKLTEDQLGDSRAVQEQQLRNLRRQLGNL